MCAPQTHRSRLLAGWVTGQRDEIFERILGIEVRWVADGRVWEVGGGCLGQDRGRGEVKGRRWMRAPGDPCRDGEGMVTRGSGQLALLPVTGFLGRAWISVHLMTTAGPSSACHGPGPIVIHMPKLGDFQGKPSVFWCHP